MWSTIVSKSFYNQNHRQEQCDFMQQHQLEGEDCYLGISAAKNQLYYNCTICNGEVSHVYQQRDSGKARKQDLACHLYSYKPIHWSFFGVVLPPIYMYTDSLFCHLVHREKHQHPTVLNKVFCITKIVYPLARIYLSCPPAQSRVDTCKCQVQ